MICGIPRKARAAALLAGAVVLASACTVSIDEQARPVDDAPVALLEPPTTETIPPAEEDEGFDLVLMFIDSAGQRVPVTRRPLRRPTEQDVLDGLAGGPTQAEVAENGDPISTGLFPSLEPMVGEIDEGVLRVIVEGEELRQASIDTPERLQRIYGQIVCSIDRLEGNRVETVLLVDGDGTISPVTEDATVLNRGVGPTDFRDCQTAADIAAEAAAEAEAEAQDPEGEGGEGDGSGDGAARETRPTGPTQVAG